MNIFYYNFLRSVLVVGFCLGIADFEITHFETNAQQVQVTPEAFENGTMLNPLDDPVSDSAIELAEAKLKAMCTDLARQPIEFGDVTIHAASEDTENKILLALLACHLYSPYEYSIINKYAKQIIEVNSSSSAIPYIASPTILLSEKDISSSELSCISALVHEAGHLRLYLDYFWERGRPVPISTWGLTKAELYCIELQANAISNVFGECGYIDELNNLPGNHWDRNKNGSWDTYDLKSNLLE